jgi:hypothetical protein
MGNHEHHKIEFEGMANVDRRDQVAHMWRVEGAAEEADSANDSLGHTCSLRKPCFYPSHNNLQLEDRPAGNNCPRKPNTYMEIKVSKNLF